MKKMTILSLLMAFTSLFTEAKNPVSTHSTSVAVNTSKSTVKWTGKKAMYSHTGTIGIQSGALLVSGGKVKGGTFTINMKDIKDTDLTDPDKNAKLVGHLKSEDFFDAEKYPTAKLVITKITTYATPKDGATHSFEAKLTIKGITNIINFPATVNITGNKFTASAKITIDRSKWGVKYGSDTFFDNLGDKVISNDIDFDISLVSK